MENVKESDVKACAKWKKICDVITPISFSAFVVLVACFFLGLNYNLFFHLFCLFVFFVLTNFILIKLSKLKIGDIGFAFVRSEMKIEPHFNKNLLFRSKACKKKNVMKFRKDLERWIILNGIELSEYQLCISSIIVNERRLRNLNFKREDVPMILVGYRILTYLLVGPLKGYRSRQSICNWRYQWVANIKELRAALAEDGALL